MHGWINRQTCKHITDKYIKRSTEGQTDRQRNRDTVHATVEINSVPKQVSGACHLLSSYLLSTRGNTQTPKSFTGAGRALFYSITIVINSGAAAHTTLNHHIHTYYSALQTHTASSHP